MPLTTTAIVIQRAALHRRLFGGIALGFALGVTIALGLYYHLAEAEPKRVEDPRMEAACKFPQSEGEMTVVTVHNDRLICWRWK